MQNPKLSNIELYYSLPVNFTGDKVMLDGNEYFHAIKVMRHKIGDEIFVTNGEGEIIRGLIGEIRKENLLILIKEKLIYENKNNNIVFCISKLKNPDRFKFALEKCVELGVTNFIIFDSERTVTKGEKKDRWKKITLAAMKQSLRAFLPRITLSNSLKDIISLQGKKIVFEQTAENEFSFSNKENETYYFIFGPEGGFSNEELEHFKPADLFFLSDHRLRSETAIVKAASLL